MDFLVQLLFESRLMLGGCLAVMLFVLLVYWRRTLKPRPLLIGLAIAVVLLVVQAAVVTRWEHADQIMKRIEAGVLASQPEAIAPALSGRFHIAETNWDDQEFLDRVRQYMQAVDVRTLTRRALEIEENDADQFQIYVSYWADISTRDSAGGLLSRWRIVFVAEEHGWRIISIEPTQMDRTTVRGWKGLPKP
ncbi:MAG: hypothetical protein KKI02_00595 [Planctomycetes bacterium]|nr:hypothetical protein [Planctomycetota bacterium]